MKKHYDIVIVGGGTAGCAAAYTAGILGFKTLLIEKNIHLGGTITSGLVIPAMNAGKNQINTDFYNALISKLRELDGQIKYQDNPGWFNPELTKIALDSLLSDVNVDVALNTTILSVNILDDHILNIYIENKILSACNVTLEDRQGTLSVPIEAEYFVDTTGDCEFAYQCGCKFLEDKSTQPASLRFNMSGVNLEKFSKWLLEYDSDREVTTVEYINGQIHLSTAYTWDSNKQWALAPLFDDAVEKNILKDHDRNYFQIFTIPGMLDSVAFNCPRILKLLNTCDIIDYTKAVNEARMSIIRLSNFCKIYFPGFDTAYISNIADTLGIRVSRRIRGKYIYTIEDLKTGKKFDHTVMRSNYPVDIHSTDKNSSTLEIVQNYELPIESLMSADIENLFVAGRTISADFTAQGALRIQPNCFAMAEGLIKYLKSLN